MPYADGKSLPDCPRPAHLAAVAVHVAEQRTVKGGHTGICVPARDIALYRAGKLLVD